MIKTIGAAALIASLLASTAMADSAGAPSEGKMNLKARLGYMSITGSGQYTGSLSQPGSKAVTDPKLAQKNGAIVELAANYFVANNVALEGSIGYGRSREEAKDSTTSLAGKNLSIIPLTALVQYHIMPEASVSPYVGVGYSYQFMSGGSDTLKRKNGGNAVGQIGVDFAFNDTMGFNIDVKHTLKTNHDVKIGSTTTKMKLATTTVMAGVTFPF